jgi:hypothetical protein
MYSQPRSFLQPVRFIEVGILVTLAGVAACTSPFAPPPTTLPDCEFKPATEYCFPARTSAPKKGERY